MHLEQLDIAQQIAERVRTHRLMLGWSRKRLAERAAVSPETLKAFERTGQISLRRLARLSVALRLDDELAKLFNTPPKPQTLDDLMVAGKRRQRGR